MRRHFCIVLCLCCVASMWAITQEGRVRTIARKDKSSVPVEGVIVRLQGSHNKVMSRANGTFSLLLNDLQNGQPYAIASIVKSGYEPAEQELMGRRMPCSDQVPLEILLVSKMQLMQEREQIESKARENVEVYFQAQVDSLEQLLASKRISEAEMASERQKLENQYENFEPLLQAISDLLARTDYSRLDSLSERMQQAVESGNTAEAERLMREKGSLAQRKAFLREWSKNISALQTEIDKSKTDYQRQKRELEEDCFRMYSSFLSRFQNDSAAIYIRERAELDTLNFDYQAQAGQFMSSIMADYVLAQLYYQRAYRIADSKYGEMSPQMGTACNELGLLARRRGDTEQAMKYYQRSMTIFEKVRGKDSEAVSELLNNLGAIYQSKKDYKKAMDGFKRSLKIREKLFDAQSLKIAESKNNIAYVLYQQGKWDQAEQLFREAYATYSSNPKAPQSRVAGLANNLGGVFYQQGKYVEAEQAFEQAVTIYRKVLGENHPLTKNALKSQDYCNKKTQ